MSPLRTVFKRARSHGTRPVRTDAFTPVAEVFTVVAGRCLLGIAERFVEGEARDVLLNRRRPR